MPRSRKRAPSPDPSAPPENRGGVRQGQPGQVYDNRQDLNVNRRPTQPVRVASGQAYGQRAAQEAAQRAVPLAGTPPVPAAAAAAAAGPGMTVPPPGSFVGPDDVPTFGAPTSRPDEPLTAGLPFGAGRNPSPLDRLPQPAAEGVGERLRALYLAFPTPELRELLEDFEIGD